MSDLRGEDWVPTTNIDATLAEMEARGLGRWVESIKVWMGSASAYYTMESYRHALADAASWKMLAESSRKRVAF